MHLLPYINSLWFGEAFNYNESPDYYLIEISGIAFGLFGTLYISTTTDDMEWQVTCLARLIHGEAWCMAWALDSDVLILLLSGNSGTIIPSVLMSYVNQILTILVDKTVMIGWWNKTCPVQPLQSNIRATVYQQYGVRSIVALASWHPTSTNVTLNINWKAIGLDPQQSEIFAPAVENFQTAKTFSLTDAIPTEPAKGWLLVIQNKQNKQYSWRSNNNTIQLKSASLFVNLVVYKYISKLYLGRVREFFRTNNTNSTVERRYNTVESINFL